MLTAFLIVLWVPVTEESSRFHVEDLLDGPVLCSQLCVPNTRDFEKTSREYFSQTPAAGRVWEVLSSETQQKIRAIAEEFRPTEPQIQALKKEGKSLQSKWRFYLAREKFQQVKGLRIELTFEQRQLLVMSLNRVLQNKNLYDKEIFADLELDRCAGGYSKRVDNGETLTSAESERFHRLLLESVFSETIRDVYVAGWRPVMISYGLLGLVIAGILGIILRNHPEQHPHCNRAERLLISASRPVGTPSPYGKVGGVPWGPMLKNWSLWCVNIENFGANIGWEFLLTWFPRYLLEVHKVPIVERGLPLVCRLVWCPWRGQTDRLFGTLGWFALGSADSFVWSAVGCSGGVFCLCLA